MRPSGAVRLALDRSDSRVFLAECCGDGSNLGEHASGVNDTTSTTFGDDRGRVGHVETVARSGVFVEHGVGVFSDR